MYVLHTETGKAKAAHMVVRRVTSLCLTRLSLLWRLLFPICPSASSRSTGIPLLPFSKVRLCLGLP